MTGTIRTARLTIDRTWIQPDECAHLRWSVEGADAVYFYAQGQPWQDHGAATAGEQAVYPAETTTYCLRVVQPDGSVQVKKRVLQVRSRPAIEQFAVDRAEIQPGETVTLFWRVGEVKATYLHAENQPWQEHAVAPLGELEVCPGNTTVFCLRAIRHDNSPEIKRLTIVVNGQPAWQSAG